MLHLLALPGPAHHCLLPCRGRRGASVWTSHPRAAARAVLQLADALLELDQPVGLLPPPLRPAPSLAEAVAWHDIAHTDDKEPALAALAWGGDDAALGLHASVFPAADCDSEQCQLVLANHSGHPVRSANALVQAQRLRQALVPDWVRVGTGAPSWPRFATSGAASQLRLGTEPGTFQLFAHQAAHGMPKELRARFSAPLSDAEGQRAEARMAQLRSCHGLFVRQLWAGIDAGADGIDQLACAGPSALLIHEQCLGDQHQVLYACQRELPKLKVLQIARTALTAADAIQRGTCGGLFVGQHYLAPAAALERDSGRQLAQLPENGLCTELRGIDYEPNLLGGGPSRVCLRLPGCDASALRPGYRLDRKNLPLLHSWVDTHHPEELLPDQLSSAASAERCQAASQAWPLQA
ncbi:MAG: N-succinylarginine dihydrolase [Planctomycetota bacterium]|jgi:succinylarginine dihydrolase|nr:N-succinylarginine dihydrolase [Planctomycetota bacterium]